MVAIKVFAWCKIRCAQIVAEQRVQTLRAWPEHGLWIISSGHNNITFVTRHAYLLIDDIISKETFRDTILSQRV